MTAPQFDGSQPCRDEDPETFFPPPGRQGAIVREKAKGICRGCHFQAACLTYALNVTGSRGEYADGIWGGTTWQERRKIRAKSSPARSPIPMPRGSADDFGHGDLNGWRAHQRNHIPIPADDSCGCRAARRAYDRVLNGKSAAS